MSAKQPIMSELKKCNTAHWVQIDDLDYTKRLWKMSDADQTEHKIHCPHNISHVCLNDCLALSDSLLANNVMHSPLDYYGLAVVFGLNSRDMTDGQRLTDHLYSSFKEIHWDHPPIHYLTCFIPKQCCRISWCLFSSNDPDMHVFELSEEMESSEDTHLNITQSL